MKRIHHIAAIVTIFAAVFFIYRSLPKTFFQQDEWWSFGTMIAASQRGGFLRILTDLTMESAKVHVVPLATLFQIALFRTFYLSFPPYAFFSIVMHGLNTLLVFYLSRLLLKKNSLSIVAALIFAGASIPQQAVSWFAAAIIVQGATFFSLTSILFLLLYLQRPSKRWYAYGSCLSLLSALFFNEYSLFLFVYLPLLAFIMAKKPAKPLLVKFAKPLGVTAVFYLSLRITMWFLGRPIVLGQQEVLVQPTVAVYAYRLLTTPLRFLSQTFVPQQQIIGIARLLTKFAYPQFVATDGVPNPYMVESVVLDLVGYLAAFVIIAISGAGYFWFRRHHDRISANALTVSLLLILTSSLPFILIPGKAGYTSIYEPRYLYLGTGGMSIMVVLWLTGFLKRIFSGSGAMRSFALIFLLIPYFLFNYQSVQKDLALLEKRSIVRRSLLTTVQKDYPALPERVIFFTQSDRSYYGLPADEPTLPVQSGFGRMLMIWYQRTENFPACFYDSLFLHDLIAQGYRQCEGRGFGYFRNYQKLLEAMKANLLTGDNVIAYSWTAQTETFADITETFRKNLRRDLVR